jgi:hypothetical protein
MNNALDQVNIEGCGGKVWETMSAADRMEVALDIISGESTTAEAHIQYNVKLRRIQKVVKQVREGCIVYSETGRQFKIDREGIKFLKEKLVAMPDMSRNEMIALIHAEHGNTHLRRHIEDSSGDIDLIPLSRSTVGRYLNIIQCPDDFNVDEQDLMNAALELCSSPLDEDNEEH